MCHGENIKASDFLQALVAAVETSDIINMSLGFYIKDCTQENPCHICEHVNYYSVNKGTVFVSAAGNRGIENSIECPGNAQEAITVGAVDNSDNYKLASYSSRGIPGIKKPNILSSGTVTLRTGKSKEPQGPVNGTSFATPVISGVAGAVFHKIDKKISKLKSYLYSTTLDIGIPEHHQGFGVLDLENLVEVLQNDEDDSKSQGQKTN